MVVVVVGLSGTVVTGVADTGFFVVVVVVVIDANDGPQGFVAYMGGGATAVLQIA